MQIDRAKPKGIHGEVATTVLKTIEGESRWGVGWGSAKMRKSLEKKESRRNFK